MANWKSNIENIHELDSKHETLVSYTSGYAIGIIAVNLIYPKLPGNVANATTYPFPVKYKVVSFEIEQLFAGDPAIKEQIVNAAKELEAEGVRAIIGACGYFAHFQQEVRDAVSVPVFMSSLCQLPMIKTAFSESKKIAVFCASGDDFDEELLRKVGTDSSRLIVQNVGNMESFSAIRWGRPELDNGKLKQDLCELAAALVEKNPDIGAILLECSDLPPYAKAIQAATGLPVFDFNTMIDLVYHSVVQHEYYGYF
ncbi:MAG: aspartate/glutamate racemase family protein [Mogibacterium sp.]|nr:aspartate/glutamate racemase family protein [Mogibacterium sp.]